MQLMEAIIIEFYYFILGDSMTLPPILVIRSSDDPQLGYLLYLVLFDKFDLLQVRDRASSFRHQYKKGIHSIELLVMLEVLLMAAMLEV